MNSSAKNAFAGIYAGKRVLVTGHTGFKGSWLTRWLLDLDAEVAGFALDPKPSETLFGEIGLATSLARDVRADIGDLTALVSLVTEFQPQFVFHLAAQPLVRLSYDIPVETFATNVMGTVNVLEALRRFAPSASGPITTVAITTDKCYENKEWLNAYREDDPMGGYDPYSASKGAAELVIAAYRRSYFSAPDSPLRIASARAGNVIGGGDWALDRIVPDCFRALRAGETIPVRNRIATRPWQHVLEPISGYLWLGALLADPSLRRYPDTLPFRSGFNFGPSLASNRTVAELVDELLKHQPGQWKDCSDPNAPHEASKLNLAIDKAFHLLGWEPVWDFAHTIEKTATWYVRAAAKESPACLCDEHIATYTTDARAKGLPWAG